MTTILRSILYQSLLLDFEIDELDNSPHGQIGEEGNPQAIVSNPSDEEIVQQEEQNRRTNHGRDHPFRHGRTHHDTIPKEGGKAANRYGDNPYQVIFSGKDRRSLIGEQVQEINGEELIRKGEDDDQAQSPQEYVPDGFTQVGRVFRPDISTGQGFPRIREPIREVGEDREELYQQRIDSQQCSTLLGTRQREEGGDRRKTDCSDGDASVEGDNTFQLRCVKDLLFADQRHQVAIHMFPEEEGQRQSAVLGDERTHCDTGDP